MWRPKDWVTQAKVSGDWDNANNAKKWEIPHSHGWSDGYEAGADAMLEALRKREVAPNYVDRRAGIFVFIPDEEG